MPGGCRCGCSSKRCLFPESFYKKLPVLEMWLQFFALEDSHYDSSVAADVRPFRCNWIYYFEKHCKCDFTMLFSLFIEMATLTSYNTDRQSLPPFLSSCQNDSFVKGMNMHAISKLVGMSSIEFITALNLVHMVLTCPSILLVLATTWCCFKISLNCTTFRAVSLSSLALPELKFS